MFKLTKEEITRLKMALDEQHKILDTIISPFLIEGLSNKQNIELCQVGKFVSLLNQPSHIILHGDSPDFIISYNGQKIGLEHERIFQTDKVESTKSVEKLFNDAALVFEKNYPNIKILANCWLKTDNFTFKKSETEKLKNEISEYIYAVSKNISTAKPSYIDTATVMTHTGVNFCYNPGAYIVTNIDKETLEKAIIKKNPLVDKYKTNSGIDVQWLLMVIGSTSPDSFEYNSTKLNVNISSSFDRVFLMEDFNSRAWQIL